MSRTTAGYTESQSVGLAWLWPTALVCLISVVTWGRGGYASWAVLTFEIGAASFWLVYLWGLATELDAGTHVRLRELHRLNSRLPFSTRHPWIGQWLQAGRRGQSSFTVEILPAGREPDSEHEDLEVYSPSNARFFFGIPFPRTGLGLPLLFLSVWLVVSLIPLSDSLLAVVSPEAVRFLEESAALSGQRGYGSPSIQPFRTLDGIGIWIGIVTVFYIGVGVIRRHESLLWLARLIVVMGTGVALHGSVQALVGLSNMVRFGSGSLVRAQASFGNPNHFAAFVMMTFLCGLGWLEWERERSESNARRTSGHSRGEQAATFVLLLTPLIVMVLAIILSFSRSAITFTLLGAGAFALLGSRQTRQPMGAATARTTRPMAKTVLALVAVVAVLVIWVGADLLIGRFATLDEHLRAEVGRVQVWEDSLEAVPDYWLTGSGLGTYRYVGPNYRSFGGPVFFSWAHNDYLQLLIELGVPGALCVALLGFAIIVAGAERRKNLSDSGLSRLHAGFCAAAIGIAAHSFTDFSLHLTSNFALLAIIVAVVVGTRAETSKQ